MIAQARVGTALEAAYRVPVRTDRPQPSSHVAAVWMVLAGIVSVQVGAAIAKDLFDVVSPTAMVWLRLATSAVVLLLLARPRVAGRSRGDWTIAVAFGMTLAVMNWMIYQSFARIPLGIAVTIEFLGPLAVAVLGSRRPRDLVWALLAGVGVVALGAAPDDLDVVGVLYAVLAGVAWAAYILLSASTGRRWPGLSGLAVASVVGAVALAPPAIVSAGPTLLDARILLLGLAVGLMSSVVPYSLELRALRRIPPRTFGVLMSLEPAAATLAALVLLGELLTPAQWVAVGCVVAASIGATRSARPASEPAPN
jgi:inner membrane transporter RhtA